VNALKFSAHAYAKINHGIAANGGGTRVNVYTLLIDFMVPTVEGYNSLYSVCDGSPELDRNSADGTVFLRADVDNSEWGVVGLGSAGGYSNLVGDYATTNSNCPELAAGLTDHLGERGAVKANTWYRLVLTYDLTSGRCAADGTSASQGVNRYLNGLQIHAGGYDKDSRLAMYPTGVLIHADNDGADEGGNPVPSTEVKETSIANIAIWDVKLTTGQVEALGKAGDPMKW
jgi:hypothetical protein